MTFDLTGSDWLLLLIGGVGARILQLMLALMRENTLAGDYL